jgi:hypothetical protein
VLDARRGKDARVRSRWLRRALLAHGAALAVAAAVLATGIVPAAAPHRVVVERQAASTERSATAGTYELTRRDALTRPVQWLACKPIAYRINSVDEPKGMTAVIEGVMTSIGRQTGTAFVYGGRTDRTFSARSFSRSTPTIYFAFTGRHDVAGQHFAWPGEVGVGGPAAAWTRSSNRTFEAVTYGRVLLYTGFRGRRTGAGATWQSLITHEVGHALNLDHRPAKSDAMYPSLSEQSPGRFSAAEVTALKGVLKRRACDYRSFSQL